MTNDPRPNLPPEESIDENELRDEPEVMERIGPEDADAEEVMENMEAYGYERMDAGSFPSSPTNQADQPGWMNKDALERSNVAQDEPPE
mgnify:CR=1 FL=1